MRGGRAAEEDIMDWTIDRRRLLKAAAAAGCAACAGCSMAGPDGRTAPGEGVACGRRIISPGCRRSRVRIAKVYLGLPGAMWPTPQMDLAAEKDRYERHFAAMPGAFADVDFVGNAIVGTPGQACQLREQAGEVDGYLLIHLSMGVGLAMHELLAAGRPTMIFAAPYSGHEWADFGRLLREQAGVHADCMLTADLDELAAAVRPIRAIHHLREAKIVNITTRDPDPAFLGAIRDRYGTQVECIGAEPVIAAYEAVADRDAWAEANRWMRGAMKVVEPDRDEIYRSCRLALAFDRILDEHEATVITADCYGTMYHKLPAFPCIGNVRLNDMGLGGICESDLRCAMTHILFQGLVGRPGFISDPTLDESTGTIILAHCLGTRKMDGPDGPSAPYRLRSIMERQEGAVPQVFMRVGQRVTQSCMPDAGTLTCFTGTIIDAPDSERGCRTKITVKVDGDIDRLWRGWDHGLHRVTCYGDIREDLQRFCRLRRVNLVEEA